MVDRGVQLSGDFGVRTFFDVTQPVKSAVALVEGFQGLLDGETLLLQPRLLFLARSVRTRMIVVVGLRQRVLAFGRTGPEPVDRQMTNDRTEIGCETPFAGQSRSRR